MSARTETTTQRAIPATGNALAVLALAGAALLPAVIHAAEPSLTAVPEIRAVLATRKFSGNSQVSAVFHRQSPSWWRADRMEVAFGSIGNSRRSRGFVSMGPVWHWGRSRYRPFAELGFSPTILAGSNFEQADMGGVLHFTTSLSVGRRFKAPFEGELVVRIQHISNGSLNKKNPGMDLVGISLRVDF